MALTSGASAQSVSPTAETGFQPNRDYLALLPWESIDTASGNLILTFTDLELPANGGRALRFQRVYNNGRTPGVGAKQWTFGIAGVPMRIVESNGVLQWVVMPDGGYAPAQFEGSSSNPGWMVTSRFGRYNRAGRILYLPDGLAVHYDDQDRADWFRDQYGNTTTLQWLVSPARLEVLQDLGAESRLITLTVGPSGEFESLEYAGRTWTYERDEPGHPELITEVVPPTGPTWTFEYDSYPQAGIRMADVKTPQGGHVVYTYTDQAFYYVDGSQLLTTTETVLATRTVSGPSVPSGGTWSFSYAGTSGPETVTVTLPSGIEVQHGYVSHGASGVLGGGWALQNRIVRTPNGEILESEERHQKLLGVVQNTQYLWKSPALEWVEVVRNGRHYRTEYAYRDASQNFSDYHNPQIKREMVDGVVMRTTTYAYDHFSDGGSIYVVGLPKSEVVTIGSESTRTDWDNEAGSGFRRGETVNGSRTTFVPDGAGNVVAEQRANGKQATFTYGYGRVKNTATAHVTTLRSINHDGTVEWESEGGRTTRYEYDALMRVTAIRPPGSPSLANATLTSYADPTGRSVTVTRGNASVTSTVDGFGRPTGSVDNRAGVRTATEYTNEGRVWRTSLPYTSSPVWTTFVYDGLGRVTTETLADGSVRSRSYGVDNVTVLDEYQPTARQTVLTYKAFGHPDDRQLVSLKDPDNKIWNYEYSVLGRLKRVTAPDGLQRIWAYDPADPTRLLSETHPESGTVTYLTYDAAGVLKARRDANNMLFAYEHDGNDRVTRITAGAQVTDITYETGTDNRTLTRVGGISTQFFYEAETGRLFARDDTLDGKTYTRRFHYDLNGNVDQVTYPSGRKVSFTYDDANRLTRVDDVTASRPVATSLQYHPSGAVTSYAAGNGVVTTVAFDPNRYWVQSITAGALNLTYAYDKVGNVTSITDSRGGSSSQTFQYDALDRLTSSTGLGGSASYSYDVHGNRTGAGYSYIPGTLRLQQQAGSVTRNFAYDNNGNLSTISLASPVSTFVYTPDSQVARATVNGVDTYYEYDADQWRVRKETTSALTHYLRGAGGELLTEVNDAHTGQLEVRDHIYAGTRLLAVVTTANVTGPSCTTSLSPTMHEFSLAGGSFSVSVTTQAGCAWTASSAYPWITITSGANGTGNGTVALLVAANDTSSTRVATVTIAGRPFNVSQPGHSVSGDRLLPGGKLLPGEFLTSANGVFKFELFPSGNLSLSGPTEEFWRRPGVSSVPNLGWAEMTTDGKLVIKTSDGAVAHTITDTASPNAWLIVQGDRNVVIYNQAGTQALWVGDRLRLC